jgi:hypothetical protein
MNWPPRPWFFKSPSLPTENTISNSKHRPKVRDNIKYWQVFEGDKQVEIFLLMSGEFANINIDDEYCCDENESIDACSNNDPFQNQIAGRDIVQLKNNIIPKELVPLEKLFDENDVARNPKVAANDEDVED